MGRHITVMGSQTIAEQLGDDILHLLMWVLMNKIQTLAKDLFLVRVSKEVKPSDCAYFTFDTFEHVFHCKSPQLSKLLHTLYRVPEDIAEYKARCRKPDELTTTEDRQEQEDDKEWEDESGNVPDVAISDESLGQDSDMETDDRKQHCWQMIGKPWKLTAIII